MSGELDRVGHEIPHHRCHLKRGEEGGGGRKREKGGREVIELSCTCTAVEEKRGWGNRRGGKGD